MSERIFHLFSQLPPELRFIIWEWCLPFRVAEQDPAFGLLDGEDGRQLCAPSTTTIKNTRLPVITSVCQESRYIALKEGQWLHVMGVLSLDRVWVQPRRDVFHLNFTPRSFDNSGRLESWPDMLRVSLYSAREIKVQTSVVAEIIYPFRLNPPMENAEDYDPNLDDYAIIDRLESLRWRNTEMIELAEFCDGYCKEDHVQQCLDVVMAAVSLHLDDHTVLQSGLFGLLGDAPIQMIDFNDLVRLSRFEALFQKCTSTKEPGIEALFRLFKTPRFQQRVVDWKPKAERIILAHMWYSAQADNPSKEQTALQNDPGSAWRPYLPPTMIESLNMVDYSPNENHPWVIGAKEIMPKLRMKIMVRWCTNQCDAKRGTEQNWDSHGILNHRWRFF